MIRRTLQGACVLSFTLAVTLGAPRAMAGDVEVIGPQRVSPGATNWSGLYIGASAGRTSGDIGWQYVIPADETGALTREPSGGIYGGHIGIQHQIGRIVVGIEAAWTGGAFDKIDELGPDSPPFAVDYDAYARLHAIRQIGPRLGLEPVLKLLESGESLVIL